MEGQERDRSEIKLKCMIAALWPARDVTQPFFGRGQSRAIESCTRLVFYIELILEPRVTLS